MQSSNLSIVHPDDASLPVVRRRQGNVRRRAAPLSDPRDIICPLDGAGAVVFRRYGRRNGPNVLVLGAKTSTRFIAGDHGWWGGLITSGGPLDLTRFTFLGADIAPDPSSTRAKQTPEAAADLLASALGRSNLLPLYALIACGDGAETALALAARTKSAVKRLCLIASPAHWTEQTTKTLPAIEAEMTIVACGDRSNPLERLGTIRRLRAYHALHALHSAESCLNQTIELAPILKSFLAAHAR